MAEQQAAQMQNQLNQLMTQVQRLTGELQESRQREGTLVERLNQVAQQQAQMRVETSLGPLVDAITESQKQVVAALQKDKKLTLIDNRGVAKPDKFGSKDEGFLRWKIRTESFILSVFPELEEPLTWAEEHEASIGKTDVEAEFGSAATIPVKRFMRNRLKFTQCFRTCWKAKPSRLCTIAQRAMDWKLGERSTNDTTQRQEVEKDHC